MTPPDVPTPVSVEARRSAQLRTLWLVGGAILAAIFGFSFYVLSGFCICDAPVRADPAAGFLGAGAAFGAWSILCGVGYLLRSGELALWLPAIIGVILGGGAIAFMMMLA